MFDAQSLLGGLLKEVTGGSGKSSAASLGMGLLGVAIAAYEHISQEQQTAAPQPKGPAPVPPAPPGGGGRPPPPALAETGGDDETALLLIDAMLAAANADGHIDAEEKARIMAQLERVGSDQDGFDYLQQRMDNPPSPEQICGRVTDMDLARQVYIVSLLAITVDTDAEAAYLRDLATRLGLDDPTRQSLDQQFSRQE